ncbi:MAG: hypothetical protein K1X71_13655 [Pirellulales bacterium]|nr:hypothetical protein [Pirellulales bacterium]
MPVITNPIGANWSAQAGKLVKASGAGAGEVNASALGLATVTDAKWTVRADSAVLAAMPADMIATGYLEGAANNGGTDPINIQLDPTGTALAGGPPTGDNLDYWLDYWLMGVWDGVTPLGAAQSDFHILCGGGPYLYSKLYLNSASGYDPPGFAFYANGQPAATLSEMTMSGSSAGTVHVPWGKWCRVTFHVLYGNPGVYEVYVNGMLVTSAAADTTTVSGGWSAQAMQLRFPAWGAGVQWRVANIQSWKGTDFSLAPMWSLDEADAGNLVTRVFSCVGATNDTARQQGRCWLTSGTGAVTSTQYNLTGSSPLRSRLVFSGNGSTPIATSIPQIGGLPFDDHDWASIVFQDVSAPAGTTLRMRLNKSDNASELYTFYVTGGKLYVYYDGSAPLGLADWTETNRYLLVVHLGMDGRARGTLVNLTKAPYDASTKTVFSFPLPSWTPQIIGQVTLTATTTASNIEVGQVLVCRRPTFSLMDSLTATSYTAATPNIRTASCVAASFPCGEETTIIPGGYWPGQEFGLKRRVIVCPLGASGAARWQVMPVATSGLEHTAGVEYLCLDGGSINDIAQVQTGDSGPTLSFCKAAISRFIKTAMENDCAIWFGTMLPRGRSASATASGTGTITLTSTAHGVAVAGRLFLAGFGGNIDGLWLSGVSIPNANSFQITGASGTGSYTAGTVTGFSTQELAAITTFNANLKAAIYANGERGLVSLSDVAQDASDNPSYYPNTGGSGGFWQDFTHPNTAPDSNAYQGAGMVAKRMIALRAISPTAPPPTGGSILVV